MEKNVSSDQDAFEPSRRAVPRPPRPAGAAPTPPRGPPTTSSRSPMVRPDGKDGMGRRRSFVAREDALPASPPSCGRRGDVRGRTRTQSARHSTRVLSQDAENMLRASFSTSLQCTEDIRMSRGSRVPPSRLRSLARCAAAARNPRSNINRVKALDFTLWQEHWSSVRAALCATRTLSRMSLGNARRSIVSKNLRRAVGSVTCVIPRHSRSHFWVLRYLRDKSQERLASVQ